jgi:hypothetical protein
MASELVRALQAEAVEINAILAISSALPDHNKNNILSNNPWNAEEKRRGKLTDANRVEMVHRFLESDSEWLYTLDDDTIHPNGTLAHMLSLGREAVSGLYFNANPPYNPIAYLKSESGLYLAYDGYEKGVLQQVDSVGFGCAIIHRSVFEKIRDAHVVFQRNNGSIIAVHKDDIVTNKRNTVRSKRRQVVNGMLVEPVDRLAALVDSDNRPFPFFALEYGRTEDHHFWEMADRVGVKPWLDTTIECEHVKPHGFGIEEYQRYRKENPKK